MGLGNRKVVALPWVGEMDGDGNAVFGDRTGPDRTWMRIEECASHPAPASHASICRQTPGSCGFPSLLFCLLLKAFSTHLGTSFFDINLFTR
jgi:hypothetical protein